jgi:TonB family protein
LPVVPGADFETRLLLTAFVRFFLRIASASNGNKKPARSRLLIALRSRLEPDYSEEARSAKVQGSVILYLEIDPTGHANNIRVIRSMGLGLDEKAMEAVTAWRFVPGTRDGRPVTVAASIEVNFRLL